MFIISFFLPLMLLSKVKSSISPQKREVKTSLTLSLMEAVKNN